MSFKCEELEIPVHYAREVRLKKSQHLGVFVFVFRAARIGSWCLKTSQSMLESTAPCFRLENGSEMKP